MIIMVGSPTKGMTFLEIFYSCIVLFATIGMFATILQSIGMIIEDVGNK